jgi:hypothetical protein
MVQAVPFFKNVTSSVIHDIMARLAQEIYLGSDFIVQMGEPGRALYFVTRGMCSVLIEKELVGASKRASAGGPSPGKQRRDSLLKTKSLARVPTQEDNNKSESRMSWAEKSKRELCRVKVLKEGVRRAPFESALRPHVNRSSAGSSDTVAASAPGSQLSGMRACVRCVAHRPTLARCPSLTRTPLHPLTW